MGIDVIPFSTARNLIMGRVNTVLRICNRLFMSKCIANNGRLEPKVHDLHPHEIPNKAQIFFEIKLQPISPEVEPDVLEKSTWNRSSFRRSIPRMLLVQTQSFKRRYKLGNYFYDFPFLNKNVSHSSVCIRTSAEYPSFLNISITCPAFHSTTPDIRNVSLLSTS